VQKGLASFPEWPVWRPASKVADGEWPIPTPMDQAMDHPNMLSHSRNASHWSIAAELLCACPEK
jgi:hypothetical protein